MRHLVIPITTAWGIRNIVLSGLAKELEKKINVSLAVPETFPECDLFKDFNVVHYQFQERGSRRYLRLRERLGDAHFVRTSQTVARYSYLRRRYMTQRRKGGAHERAYQIWKYYQALLDSRLCYSRLQEREKKLWTSNCDPGVRNAVASWRADGIFFTTPHNPHERELARWAKELKIKTSTFVLSFDNLTTKGGHSIVFDQYFVWNGQMKSELLAGYPAIEEKAVNVVGTPQFQFYFMDKYKGSREELCSRLNLSRERPVILYTAGPDSLYPHEVPAVFRLAGDIQTKLKDLHPQLVIRFHPVERDRERWNCIREAFPDVKFSVPWNSVAGQPLYGTPDEEDLKALTMLMRYSHVVINCASTTTLDALISGTPAVCVDYTLPPYEGFAPYLHHFYDYDHYRPITRSNAVPIVTSPEELIEETRRILRNRDARRAERVKLVRELCGESPQNSVQRVAAELSRFINQ